MPDEEEEVRTGTLSYRNDGDGCCCCCVLSAFLDSGEGRRVAGQVR